MKIISEIFALIRSKSSRKHPALRYFFKSDAIYTRLLKGFVSGDYADDDAAAQDLYQADASDQRYTNTKHRLMNQLISTTLCLNIEQPAHSEYLTNIYSAKRELFAAEVFQFFQLHEAYHFVIRRVLPKAVRYQATDVELRCHEMLRDYHTMYGPAWKANDHARRALNLARVRLDEIHAINTRNRIRAEFAHKTEPRPELALELEEECRRIEANAAEHKSRVLVMGAAATRGLLLQLLGRWKDAREVYFGMLQYLADNPHLANKIRRSRTCRKIVECSMFMRDYETGFKYAEEGFPDQTAEMPSWFNFALMYFLLCMHAGNYGKAAEIFRLVVSREKFHNVAERVEIWQIFEAYLRFVLGPIEKTQLPAHITIYGRSFNIYRFLNEVPHYQQDKRGVNIAILIVHILHLLRERKFEPLDSRIRCIQEYMSRQLRRDDGYRPYYRTEVFLRMLRVMKNKEYNYSAVKARSQRYLDKLHETAAVDPQGDPRVLEILPYEELWNSILRELQQIEQEGCLVQVHSGRIAADH